MLSVGKSGLEASVMNVTAGRATLSLFSYQSNTDSVILLCTCNNALNDKLEF